MESVISHLSLFTSSSPKVEPRREGISSRGGRVRVYLHLRVLTNAVLGDVVPLGVNHLVRKVLQLQSGSQKMGGCYRSGAFAQWEYFSDRTVSSLVTSRAWQLFHLALL